MIKSHFDKIANYNIFNILLVLYSVSLFLHFSTKHPKTSLISAFLIKGGSVLRTTDQISLGVPNKSDVPEGTEPI